MAEQIQRLTPFSKNLLALSWVLIFLFILIERLGVLLNIYDSIPKSVLLNLKYSAVLLCFFAMITWKKSEVLTTHSLLLASLLIILIISFSNIKDYGSAINFQEVICWLYVFMNALLVGEDYNILLNLLLCANAFSLLSILFGEKAWSEDGRLEFLKLPGRLSGLFGQPNVTALCAAFTIFCILKNTTKYSALHFIIGIITLILTASLTVLFGILFAILIVLVYNFVGQKLAFILSLSILVFSIVYPFTIRGYEVNFLTTNKFTGRVAIWEWTKKLIFTPGFEPNIDLFNTHFASLSSHIPWFHAHNQFLMNWATGGQMMALAGVSLPLSLILIAFSRSKGSSTSAMVLIILLVNLTFEVPLFLDKLDSRALLLILVIHKVSERTPEEENRS
jgi:hypothetical protein